MTKISKTNQDLQAVPKGFTPINGSKLNSVALSCINIALVAQGAIPLVDGVTPLGHELNSKGGIIDLTILSGRVHTLESFIDALDQSGLKRVENDRKKYPKDTFRAVLAHRTVDHITWCSNTKNDAHKGFGHRLEKVSLYSQREAIAKELNELAGLLAAQYNANYKELYDNK